MKSIFSNPEFIRYSRTQLRPNKLVATAIVSLALSLTIGFFILRSASMQGLSRQAAGASLLQTAFVLQSLVLAAGGGIACLISIYSEKEQNTFDYQRITRLTSSELALGKLFGAPLLMYFICLCLTPLTIYAAVVARAHPSHLLAAYVVLLIASLAFHTFTLLLSLLAVRGSQLTGILLALLVLWLASVDIAGGFLHVHPIGPFEAGTLAAAPSWEIWHPGDFRDNLWREKGWYEKSKLTDVFWGRAVHHFPVLVGIDLFLSFWFLLGVVRNIKRDPQGYEVYSPLQFLGFTLFLNFLLVGFYAANWATPLDAQALLLTFDMVIFSLLGIALLRSRERMRSLLSTPGRNAAAWWNVFWPAPVLGLGATIVGILIVVDLNYSHSLVGSWDLNFALLRSLFFTLWIVRDIQFLQCMNLRAGKHPLVMAVLYLSIYYVCASFVLSAFGGFRIPEYMPVSSLFVPSAMFLLDPKTWEEGPNLWVAGFGIHLVLIGVFFYLQRRRMGQLRVSLTTAPDGGQ